MTGERGAAILVILGALIFGLGTFDHALWTPDEPRVAAISREIADHHGIFVPTLNGRPFLEKPPLYYWCSKLSMSVLGESAGPARLPSLLFALGTGLMALLVAARIFGAGAGAAAFLLTLYSAHWMGVGHRAIVDSALAFFVAVALYGVQRLLDPTRPRDPSVGLIAFHLGAIGAFWSKGPVGIAFAYLALVGSIAILGRWRQLRNPWLWLGGVGVILGSGAWFFAMGLADPGGTFVSESFSRNVLERFAPSEDGVVVGHVDSNPFYYLLRFPARLLPGSLLLIYAGLYYRRNRTTRAAWAPSLSLVILGGLLLTVAGTKRALYALPLIAPAAVLLAPVAVAAIEGALPWGARRAVTILSALAIAFVVAVPGIRYALVGDLPLSTIGLSIAALGVGAASFLGRDRSWLRGALPAVALMGVYAAIVLGWMDQRDREESCEPFVELVQSEVPPGTPLVTYHGDENTRAILCFRMRREVTELTSYPELTEMLARRPAVPVIFALRLPEGDLPPRGTRGSLSQFFSEAPGIPPDPPPAVEPTVEILGGVRLGKRRCWLVAIAVEE